MKGRARIALIGLVVVLAALGVGGVTVTRLYDEAFDQQRQRLIEVARGRARLIEAMARFDVVYSPDFPGGPVEATLTQVREAHEHFEGFGRTGEFVLARRDGDHIDFLLRHRGDSVFVSSPVALSSPLAEPMRRALNGQSGTVVGLDYDGRTVLAAYEPVAVLDLGLVAKIDLAEIRAPFIRAGVGVAGWGVVLIVVGLVFVITLGGGLVGRIERLESDERRTLERLRLIRQRGRVGTLDVDVRASRFVMDPMLSRILGHEDAETVCSPTEFLDRVHPDDRPAMLRAFDESRGGVGDAIDQVFRIRTADGRYRSVVAAIHVVEHDASGPATRLVGTITDVTALEEARDALMAREAHLRAAQEMGQMGSWEWTTGQDVMWWSDELYRILGAVAGAMPATVASFLELVHPDDRDGIATALGNALAGGEPDEQEFRIVRPDGVRWVRAASRPQFDDQGTYRKTIGFLQDITDAREMAGMLRVAQKMETLGQLTAGIAHDFNNVLTAIQVNADILLDQVGGTDAAGGLEVKEIQTVSRLGADMVRRLMSFSRVGLDDIQVVDVRETLNETRSLLARLMPEGMVVRVAPGHGHVACRIDPGSLQEILINLATNARDAMAGHGSLTIESLAEDVGGEACLRIRVRDTGSGMDEATLARIFEPFFTTKAVGRGTGLGLAMVRALVERQGGRVTVESLPGHGTTFTLSFPAVAPDVEARDAVAPEPDRLSGTEPIAIVEDDPAIRRAASAILRRYGYAVAAFSDAEGALRALRSSGQVSLVISDVMLPNMTGIDFYLQSRDLAMPPRFLLMSGYGAADIARAGNVGREVQFLRKPWGVDELLRAVRAALDTEAPAA